MSVTSLLERIAGKQHERRQQHIATYRELVAAIAAGQEPEPEVVETTLAQAGKSLEELRQAVELYQKRTTLKALVATMPSLEAEQQEVQQQMAQADKALADAEQRHEEATWPLQCRLQEIKQALSDAEEARRGLFLSCDDPELRRQLDEITAELQTLNARKGDLHSRAAYFEDKARDANERADRESSESEVDYRREKSVEYEKQAAAARRTTKELEKQQAKLSKRREEIEQQMRDA